MSITNTTISGNAANNFIIVDRSPAPNVEQEGGGGVDEQYGSMSIANSTISGNVAGPSGGPGGGVVNEAGTLSIMNSTVSGNTANADGGGIANDR